MFVDLRKLDNKNAFFCDVCVIGSGPAGCSIALEFLNTSKNVIVLESGGEKLEPSTQELYKGETIGVSMPHPLDVSRKRFFGGSSNCWAGTSGFLDDIDFRKRPWVPYSGWPISKKELMPFYYRATKILEIKYPIFDDRLLANLPEKIIPFSSQKLKTAFLRTSLMQYGNFGRKYRKHLEDAPNVRVILHANVTDLKANGSASRLEYVQIKSLGGKVGRVKAKVFVLACGGIENARILLYSNSVVPKGLGNENDLVGRFFMDHIIVPAATIYTKKNSKQIDLYNELRFGIRKPLLYRGQHFATYIVLSEKMQRDNKLLNIGAFLADHPNEFSDALRASIRLRNFFMRQKIPKNSLADIWEVIKNLDEVLPAAYNRVFGGGGQFSRIAVKLQIEQNPSPLSRVSLSKSRDALGLNRTVLEWKLSKIERKTAEVMLQTLSSEFGRLGIARMKYDRWLNDPGKLFPEDLRGGQHHTGTTRMADDPKNGVVDRNCRVHSMKNLYISGSSVFPTNGWIHPTLTICALAIRLADHIINSRV